MLLSQPPTNPKSKRCLSRPSYALFCKIEKILRLHRWTSINNQHPTNFIKILEGIWKYSRLAADTFKNNFYLEMHQNNFFFIFLNLFLTSTNQNNPKTLKINLKEKKNQIFMKSKLNATTNSH